MQSLANETAASQTPQINPDHNELNKHSDLAFAFLRAADGDKHDIEAMLDDFIDLDAEATAVISWPRRPSMSPASA